MKHWASSFDALFVGEKFQAFLIMVDRDLVAGRSGILIDCRLG